MGAMARRRTGRASEMKSKVVVPQALVFSSKACAALGHGQLDHSALVKALEAMAQHPVAPDA